MQALAAGRVVVMRPIAQLHGALPMSSAPPATIWSLHRQLEADTVFVGDLPLSRVVAMTDANYPWLLLVPRRIGASELADLDVTGQGQLMAEITQVSRALKTVAPCDKLNVAALGNIVPQLHVHVIARRTGDPAWPRPVWGVAPPLPYVPEALARFTSALRQGLSFT
jgi:diadenosine tetraphosphate (Ap4A) HIT family hydrolase